MRLFTVTKSAADQIRSAAQEDGTQEMALRIAASTKTDGSLDYAIGFDVPAENDVLVSSEGVRVLIGREDVDLLEGATMDYVELEPGQFRFIFLNPNDPHYSPPKQK